MRSKADPRQVDLIGEFSIGDIRLTAVDYE